MKLLTSLVLACVAAFVCSRARAQTTATTTPVGLLSVQGVLHSNGVPFNGYTDLIRTLTDAETGGTELARSTNNNVSVSNGILSGRFILWWDFPIDELRTALFNAFSTASNGGVYLELASRPSGTTNPFTVLSPRQRVVPSLFSSLAAYADTARTLTGPLPASLMPTSPVSGLTFTSPPTFMVASGPPFSVTSSAAVAGLNADLLDGYDSSAFWKLLGNAGTTPGLN